MKKILASAALAMGITVCYAVPPENCGCGIGTLIFEGQDGLLSQTLAVTTNGIFINNLFGITSGTLDCDQASTIASLDQLKIFVAGNMDNLANDIAIGDGEYLDTLAQLMGVNEADREEFAAKMQYNFEKIYPADTVSHEQVVSNLLDVYRS